MENLRVLLYPQVTDREGGPFNVIRYLSVQLKKNVNVYEYPLFSFSSKNKSLLNYIDYLGKIWSVVLARKFNIAHLMISPWILNGSSLIPTSKWFTDLPTIVNVHGIMQMEEIYKESPKNKFDMIYKINTLICCRNATRVVVNSKFMLKNVVDWYNIDPSKIALIPNGVEVKHFSDCNERLNLEGDPCVLFVGRFALVKGAGTVLEAIALVKRYLPSIKVHFVGCSYPLPVEIQALINKAGVAQNIVLHNWVSQDKIPSYYKSADFCIFGSFIESFGIVILEAMAAGTPIIASDINAYRELLTQEVTGLFFRAGDSQDLSRAIFELATNSGLRHRLSKNANLAVQTYDWENIARKYLELYYSIIK
jgi:glycosyltransferase involved in cell wall biosynthesis